jgi:hypothetical protein
MIDYAVCYKCNGLIYRGKANGQTWQHIDYRADNDHRAVPVIQEIKKIKAAIV